MSGLNYNFQPTLKKKSNLPAHLEGHENQAFQGCHLDPVIKKLYDIRGMIQAETRCIHFLNSQKRKLLGDIVSKCACLTCMPLSPL